MSSDELSDKECPLCMEPFEEVNFFPCTCQYQICTFCWHRLRTDDNGLCPACRQPYPEKPVNYQPLSLSEIQKLKTEKKQKNSQKNKFSTEGGKKADRQHLSVFRVLQRNLVYVVGLSQRLADAELLRKSEYFGKFGKIVKVAVGMAQGSNTNSSYTAYVTYSKIDDALRAIQAVNNLIVDGRLVKASLGTTKYCSNFLKGQLCHKQECMYLHEVAEEDLSFTKDDMHQGKHTEYERKLQDLLALKIQQQSAVVTTKKITTSSVSSGSISPVTTITNEGVNDLLTYDIKPSSPVIETNSYDLNIVESEPLTTKMYKNDVNYKPRNESESSRESNIQESNSDMCDGEIQIENHDIRCIQNEFNIDLQPPDFNNPPPGFSKIPEKSLLLESQTAQQESSCSSSFSMMEQHINGWFDSGNGYLKSSPINDLFQQSESYNNLQTQYCAPSHLSDISVNQMPIESTTGKIDSLFQKNYNNINGNDNNVKMKLISSDSKSVMTCDELERILLNNSIPPGFKRQDSLNSCTGATAKSYRQTPVSSGMNFFLDLYDDLGFDPFSESSKALADMLEEEKTTSASI